MQKQPANGCSEVKHEGVVLSQEDLSWLRKEVLHSMQQVRSLSEKKKDAGSEIAQLLSPFQVASNEAKELAIEVEESNAEEKAHELKLHSLLERERSFDLDEAASSHVLTDLGDAKEQLRRLRASMASASESKAEAETDVEDSSVMAERFSSLIEEMKEEIAEEASAIAAQREAEAACFSKSIDYAAKLKTTALDIDALQNEIKVVRAINKSLHTECSTKGRTEKGMDSSLQSAKDELATAKEELRSLREEGYKLMSEMDDIRRDLQQIADQKEKSSRNKNNSDFILEHLNRKFRSSRSKLEVASFSEKRAEEIVCNISAALRQLQVDTEAAKMDTGTTCAAIRAARIETERTKHNVFSMERRLQRATRDLKEGIAFEDLALMKLRTISQSRTSGRTFSSSNSITISKFEYYYLIKQAKTAQEIASQKVAAAQAWIEVPTAEADHRRRLSILRKGHIYAPKRPAKTEVNIHDLNFKLAIAMPRRSVTVNRVSGTHRRTKRRIASMSSGRQTPALVSSNACLAGSKRKNIMLKIVRFLGGGSGSGKQP